MDYKIIDDPVQAAEAFKIGQCDLVWATVDSLPTSINSFKTKNCHPKASVLIDYSR